MDRRKDEITLLLQECEHELVRVKAGQRLEGRTLEAFNRLADRIEEMLRDAAAGRARSAFDRVRH